MWIFCGLLCAWATLRIIGGERERRMNDLTILIASMPPAPAPAKDAAASGAANSPVRSKAAR